jgi:hypothetical protein
MADDRTYIKLHDGMPGHPKVRGLSDKAFRTFVSALCYCSEYLTDGAVVSAVARDLGNPRVWAELTAAGLVESAPGGYLMHDYLQHQRSADEVRALKEKRREAGKRGGAAKAKALARARGGATEVLRSKTGSQIYPETESLTNVRDQAETDPSLRSGTTRKRAQRIPDDFALDADLRTWGHGRGFSDLQLDEITDRFTRYWQAKAGRDATKLDWGKTWQNWAARETPASVAVLPRLAAANGERTWSTGELEAVLGPDRWTCPQPPSDLTPEQKWEWEQQTKREHRAERVRLATEKLGRSA